MERAQGAGSENSSHPRPLPARILKTDKPNVKVMKTGLETIFLDEVKTVREELVTASKFEDPNVQTISAKQMQAFNNEIAEDESSYHENFNSPYVMTIQEQKNLNELEALLTNTAGRNAEASMPFVTTQQADELIIDFGEQEQANIIPIMPEYEDQLEAADYDAYCDVVNW